MTTVANNNSYPLLAAFKEKNQFALITELEKPSNLIRELQSLLNAKGFNSGEVDGIVGPRTLKALEKAKNYLSLQYPAMLGPTTIKKLIEMSPLNNGFFLPTNGIGKISSHFGFRTHPISGARRQHRGVDIASTRGTVIYAVADGVVSLAVAGCVEGNTNCGGRFGNFIRIQHLLNEFNESVYAHLQEVFVKQNQLVKAGDTIGTMGNTGSSTGPHLHLELWKNNRAFNPLDVMEVV